MLSETDKYILKRCKKDAKFAKEYTFYNQMLDATLLVFRFRKHMHLTQAQLAQRAKVSRTTIARIENGDLNPSVLLLSKIARSCDKKLSVNII